MSISEEEFKRIARLAKLKFKKKEKEQIKKQLSEIINYVEKINELALDDVQPVSHVLDLKNVLRKDEVGKGLSQKEALLNAPVKYRDFFCVPKVIWND